MNKERVQELIRELLVEIGEDPEREGLERTPRRVAESYAFLTSGYNADPVELINEAVFSHEADQMIIARNIDVYSLCEHHMLPFFGRCHVGYIPDGKVLGVSKIARLVDMYARRLQIQERLTEQIAHAINEAIEPRGVGVTIEARHLCMTMRGVEKTDSLMVTSSVLGSFRASEATRAEFMALIRQSQ
ncbi:MAG TPA: GTP cyclohydrolase I FolE [Gaiellaceae bacterium]